MKPPILASLALAAALHAQSSESPKFDVASVRLHDFQATDIEPLRCSNGRLIVLGAPLYVVIPWAYDLDQNQIRDMRDRLPKDAQAANLFYDIQATSERPLTESQCKAAVQALLADRFKLVVHWESKKAQVYDLTVARGGPKMRKVSDSGTEIGVNITVNDRPLKIAGSVLTGWTMQDLAEYLTLLPLHTTVTDKTGLEGKYKITLSFSNRPPRDDQVFL